MSYMGNKRGRLSKTLELSSKQDRIWLIYDAPHLQKESFRFVPVKCVDKQRDNWLDDSVKGEEIIWIKWILNPKEMLELIWDTNKSCSTKGEISGNHNVFMFSIKETNSVLATLSNYHPI